MRSEYDFSKGKRGRFFRKKADLQLPIYLEDEVLKYLQDRAHDQGIELNDLVNTMLKQGIALIETTE